jgi:hypothetical protein
MTTEWRRWPRDPRYIACANGQVVGPSGVPVGSVAPSGHVIVTYRTPSGRKSVGAHVIVCEAFHGPAPAVGMEVAHEDGEPGNNQPGNLRWTARPGNSADRVRHERNGLKLTNEAVQAIRAAVGESSAALAARHGVSRSMISHIRTGRAWSNLPPAA